VNASDLPPPLAVVFQVIAILEELGVRYHLGGSFASTVHGVPRQTMDADFVLDVNTSAVSLLVDRLRGDFYVDLAVAKDAVARHGSFNAIHLDSGFKIDFFVKGDHDYDDVELERSREVQISVNPPRTALVKSAEDIVLRKLQWFRDGGEVSERQWKDVLGVLVTVGDDLDFGHLRPWAEKLGISDLLERATAEVQDR
jgi:hypothetical protein